MMFALEPAVHNRAYCELFGVPGIVRKRLARRKSDERLVVCIAGEADLCEDSLILYTHGFPNYSPLSDPPQGSPSVGLTYKGQVRPIKGEPKGASIEEGSWESMIQQLLQNSVVTYMLWESHPKVGLPLTGLQKTA